MPVFVPPLAAALIALAAGLLAAVAARPLLRAVDSPTLPERLLQWSGQHRFVAVLAYVPLLLSGRSALWAMPLAWLGLQLTTHRVRRTVYGDQWSLGAQIAWNVRSMLAIQAWWWAAMFAPAVLLYADAPPLAVLATGVALLAWSAFYNDILAAILGARPVDAPALRDAFEPVLAKATIPRPRLLRAGPRGARLINAFALGSLRGDAVLFLARLLEELPPVESAAILAHEIGHLEDFATRRWTVHGLAPLLVVGGTAVTLAVGSLGWDDWLGLVWLLVVFAALVSRSVRVQQREADSDRRAVELCGDGEALIRALVAIHEAARVPRRFRPEFAQRATHPSLARRIQAIRALAGVTPAAVEPRAFAGRGVPRAVVFEDARIAFVTLGDAPPDLADPSALVRRARHLEALPYRELTSLHVDPTRDGGATLVAVDRRGETRRLAIADADVAAVQAMLDAADAHLGPPAPPQHLAQIAGRIVAIAALLVAVPLSAWSVVATALVTLVRPTTPLLGAVAAAVLTTALLQARHPATAWQVAAIVLIGGIAAIIAARQYRLDRAHDAPFRWDGFLLAGYLVTGAAALVYSWLMVVLGRDDLWGLHVAARTFAGGAAGWAALGGLSLLVPRRLARLTALASATMASGVALIGSNTFRDRVVPDPLVSAAPAVVIQDLSAAPDGRLTAPGRHWHVALAPDAQHVVLMPGRGDDGGPARIVVAGFDGWQRVIDADAVRVVDAATLLVARWAGHTLRLSAEPVRSATPRWSIEIDDASTFGAIDVAPSGRWRAEPYVDIEAGDAPYRLEGHIGDATVTRVPFHGVDPSKDLTPDISVGASGAAIAVRREFTGRWHRLSWLVPGLTWRSVLERIDGTAPGVLARSRLAIACSGPSLTSASATCLAQTGDDTFVWEVAADAGTPRPIATMTGRVVARAYDDRALTLWRERDLLMIWRGTHHALRIASDRRTPRPHDGSYAAGHVVTLARDGDRDVVMRYPFVPPND